MAWVTPPSFTSGEVLTAAAMNIISGDLSFLGGVGFATVATSETTTSTSFTDLSTPGPAVTVTTGTGAIVITSCQLSNNTGGAACRMGVDITGATTLAVAGNPALEFEAFGASASGQFAMAWAPTLTPGSNIFTAKYDVSGDTGTFAFRWLIVIPLP